VNVSESCSCGAAFSAEGDNVVRLLREWRKDHVCTEKPEPAAEGTFTVSNAQVEQAPVGFALMHPGRQDHSLDEE
jgi:hypothetical protein